MNTSQSFISICHIPLLSAKWTLPLMPVLFPSYLLIPVSGQSLCLDPICTYILSVGSMSLPDSYMCLDTNGLLWDDGKGLWVKDDLHDDVVARRALLSPGFCIQVVSVSEFHRWMFCSCLRPRASTPTISKPLTTGSLLSTTFTIRLYCWRFGECFLSRRKNWGELLLKAPNNSESGNIYK